jgi:hypothetical protein
MIGTLCVVVAALAIAIIGREVVDPMALVPAWCTDQEYVRNDPCPRFGSDGADIARASQLQHTAEAMNRGLAQGGTGAKLGVPVRAGYFCSCSWTGGGAWSGF